MITIYLLFDLKIGVPQYLKRKIQHKMCSMESIHFEKLIDLSQRKVFGMILFGDKCWLEVNCSSKWLAQFPSYVGYIDTNIHGK